MSEQQGSEDNPAHRTRTADTQARALDGGKSSGNQRRERGVMNPWQKLVR